MRKLIIEVSDEMFEKIKDSAKKSGINEEKFIAEILARYIIDPHIMKSEAVKNAYQECGEINLEIANL